MTAARVRIPGPLAEQRMGNKLYRVEVVAHMTFDLTATSEQDAEFLARRCARGVVYNEEICEVLAKPVNLIEQMKSDNLKGWLEGEAYQLLTPEQQSRSDAGQLAEPELLHVAREELFAQVIEARWKPLRWGDIVHAKGCQAEETRRRPGIIPMDVKTFKSNSPHALSDALYLLRSHPWLMAQGADPRFTTVEHRISCRECSASVARSSVSISVPFAGRMLTREYAL